MPPRYVRDLYGDPKYDELPDEVKQEVFNYLAEQDEEFAVLDPSVKMEIRGAITGAGRSPAKPSFSKALRTSVWGAKGAFFDVMNAATRDEGNWFDKAVRAAGAGAMMLPITGTAASQTFTPFQSALVQEALTPGAADRAWQKSGETYQDLGPMTLSKPIDALVNMVQQSGPTVALAVPQIAAAAAGGIAGMGISGPLGAIPGVAAGWLAGRPAEASMEAESTRREALSKGATEEQAAEAAQRTLRANMPLSLLDIPELAVEFMPLSKLPWASKYIKKLTKTMLRKMSVAAARGIVAAGLEGGEEWFQESINNWAQESGADVGDLLKEAATFDKEKLEAFKLGAGQSALMLGAGAAARAPLGYREHVESADEQQRRLLRDIEHAKRMREYEDAIRQETATQAQQGEDVEAEIQQRVGRMSSAQKLALIFEQEFGLEGMTSPKDDGTVTVNLPSGKSFKVETAPATSLTASEEEVAEFLAANPSAVGKVLYKPGETEITATGDVIARFVEAANTKTRRHEILHVARGLGLISEPEWQSLVEGYAQGVDRSDERAVEEAVARGIESQKATRTWFDALVEKVRAFAQRVSEAGARIGLFMGPQYKAPPRELARQISSGEVLRRTQAQQTIPQNLAEEGPTPSQHRTQEVAAPAAEATERDAPPPPSAQKPGRAKTRAQRQAPTQPVAAPVQATPAKKGTLRRKDTGPAAHAQKQPVQATPATSVTQQAARQRPPLAPGTTVMIGTRGGGFATVLSADQDSATVRTDTGRTLTLPRAQVATISTNAAVQPESSTATIPKGEAKEKAGVTPVSGATTLAQEVPPAGRSAKAPTPTPPQQVAPAVEPVSEGVTAEKKGTLKRKAKTTEAPAPAKKTGKSKKQSAATPVLDDDGNETGLFVKQATKAEIAASDEAQNALELDRLRNRRAPQEAGAPGGFGIVGDHHITRHGKVFLRKGSRAALLNVVTTSRAPLADSVEGAIELAKHRLETDRRVVGKKQGDRKAKPAKKTKARIVAAESAPLARNVFSLAAARKYRTQREFRFVLAEVGRAYLAKNGLDPTLTSDGFKDDAMYEYMVEALINEAEFALTRPNAKRALDWYRRTTRAALNIVAELYPEVLTDASHKSAFTAALAISSNGTRAESNNFRLALASYEHWRETGELSHVGVGNAKKQMNAAIDFFNRASKVWGGDLLSKFLATEMTVGDVEKITGKRPHGERVAQIVLGASVFGPKIGNGFYGNLNGFYDQLTMDRWWVRMWRRLTGEIYIPPPAEKLAAVSARMERAIDALRRTNQVERAEEILKIRLDEVSIDEIHDRVVSESTGQRKGIPKYLQFNVTDELKELRIAANAYDKVVDSLKDTPTKPERPLMRKAVKDVVDRLSERTGIEFRQSDFQALLWFVEKDLYDTAAADGKKDKSDNLPDYLTAARKIVTPKLAEAKNLSKEAARERVQEAERRAGRERTGEAGHSDRVVGGLEAAEGVPLLSERPRGLTRKEAQFWKQQQSVIFEVAPDPNNTTLADEWRELIQSDRLKISKQVASVVIEKLLKALGATGSIVDQIGSYMDDTNPSFALKLSVLADAPGIAKAAGYMLSQDSVIVLSPQIIATEKTGFVSVDVGTMKLEMIEQIYNNLREIEVAGEKPVGGQSTISGKMVILNYSDLTTDELSRLVAERLEGEYKVGVGSVGTAFIGKDEYGYDNQETERGGSEGDLRGRMDTLRGETQTLLRRAIEQSKAGERIDIKPRKGKGSGVKKLAQISVKGNPPTRRQIKKVIEQEFGLNVVSGHLRGEQGAFLEKARVLRSKEQLDLDEWARQLAQRVRKDLGWTENDLAHHHNELVLLAEQTLEDPNDVPDEGWDIAGWREYFRAYLSHPVTVRTIAPNFHKTFQEALSAAPELKASVDAVKTAYREWYGATAYERALASIDWRPSKIRAFNLIEWKRGFERKWIDRFAPIRWAVAEMAVENALSIPAAQDAYKLAIAYAQTSSGMAEAYVTGEGLLIGEKTYLPSLKTGLAEYLKANTSGDAMEKLIIYAWAQRTVELSKKKDAQGRPAPHATGLSVDDANELVRTLRSIEQIDNAAKFITQWNHALIDWVVAKGGLTKAQGEAIKNSAAYYIPLRRAFDEKVENKSGLSGGRGIGSQGEIVKKLTRGGSMRQVLNPWNVMMAQAQSMFEAGQKAMVARALVQLMEGKRGSGRFMVKVASPMTATSVKVDRAVKDLERLGATINGLSSQDLEGIINFYSQTGYRGNEPIISLNVNGKRQWYHVVDKELYAALRGMDEVQLPRWLSLLGAPARLVRLGATGLNPGFSLWTNLVRDMMTSALQSEAGNPLALPARIGYTYASKQGRESMKMRRALGGHMTSFLGLDNTSVRVLSDELSHSAEPWLKQNARRAISHPIDAARRIFSFSENLNRNAEFDAIFRKQMANGADFESAVAEAMIASKEVSVNFTRAGTHARILNQFVPFFNASIQGLSKFNRTMRKNPAVALARVTAMITMPALALWWMNKDKDWYKELPLWEKVLFFHFDLGDGKVIRVPWPYEWGIIFGGWVVGAADEYINGNRGEFGKALVEGLKSMVPDLMPTFLRIPTEVLADYSFFRGAAIVPEHLSAKGTGVQPWAQYMTGTSEAYKWLGKALGKVPGLGGGVSPMKLQHLADSVTGGLSRNVTDLIKKREETEPADVPVFGRMFSRQNRLGRSATEFYRVKENVEQAYNTLRKLAVRDKDFDQASRFLADNKELLGVESMAIARLRLRRMARGKEGVDLLDQMKHVKTVRETAAEMQSSKNAQDWRKTNALASKAMEKLNRD